MSLKTVLLTHRGQCREHNEDGVAINNDIYTGDMSEPILQTYEFNQAIALLLADGMGGHQCGEIASRWTLETLAPLISETGLSKANLITQIQAVNRGLFEQMQSNPQLTGMGTTLVGLYCDSNRALLFNVGDSRAYRVQDGFLALLTTDDTYDRSTFGEASGHFKTGRISQALGGAEQFIEIEPHICELKLVVGDTFLLCSDGLTDMLTLDNMEAAFNLDLLITANQLFNAAMQAGGADNISILLARVE